MKKSECFSKSKCIYTFFDVLSKSVLVFICAIISTTPTWSQNLDNSSAKIVINTTNPDPHFQDRHSVVRERVQPRPPSIFATLWREGMLELTLETDHEKLANERAGKKYQSGTLEFQDNHGETVRLDIQVKTRGNMRLRECTYAPLKIHHTGSDESLKIVLGCKSDDVDQQALVREYVVYKLYNIISDHSLQVQLVNLLLKDINGNDESKQIFALIIEGFDESAARLGAAIYRSKKPSTKDLKKRSYQTLALFQYFVGNTDWQVSSQHNIRFIEASPEGAIEGLPYDFDHGGLVNASYAVPAKNMPITSVQDRFFSGDCDLTGYEEVAQIFFDHRDELLNVPKNCRQLNDASREYVINYMNRSFEILANRSHLRSEIKRGCTWQNK